MNFGGKMRSFCWPVIAGLALLIVAACPTWADNGAAETQKQTVLARAVSPALVPSLPVLKVADDRTCEQRIKEWDQWFVICLKECKDIAAGYAFSFSSRNSESPQYKRELDGCLAACRSKYKYYRDAICQ